MAFDIVNSRLFMKYVLSIYIKKNFAKRLFSFRTDKHITMFVPQ